MKIYALILLLTLGKINIVQCQANQKNLDSLISDRDTTDYDKIFTLVDKEATFPGGPQEWIKYLQRNLDASAPINDSAPVGNYSVKVQFMVDKEGNLTNVHAIEKPKGCPTCVKAAERIIKKGPKWNPAFQDGRNVNYLAQQIITFAVAAN